MRPKDPLDAGQGDLLRFDYPERNLLGVRSAWKTRTIVIERVVDTLREPVPARWFTRRPLVNRGRYLIHGYDLELGRHRKFYRAAMRGIGHTHWLQLGIYDPSDLEAEVRRLNHPFAPTARDRLFLADVIRHFHRMTAERDDIWMNLGVFPWVRADGYSRWYSTET